MSRTVTRRRQLFEQDEVYTPEEVGERLKATPRQVRRWVVEHKIDPEGVIDLPRGRLIYGSALNEFVTGRTGRA